MNETWVAIIAAIITGICSLVGVYFANRKSQALVEYRLLQLEEKVDKHNSIIERTYKLEGQMTEVQHDIQQLRQRPA